MEFQLLKSGTMSDVLHWNELPAQIDSIIANVWAKLEVDKQLQQAQEQIDEINNGHSKIGEIFESVEQGLIDLDTDLHPSDSSGQPTGFFADITSSLANVQTDLNDLHQKFDDFKAIQDNAEKKEGFVFVYSDESMSPSPIPDQQDESMDATIPHTTSEPTNEMRLQMEIEASILPATNRQNDDGSTSQCFTLSNESPSKCNDSTLRTSTHYEPSTTVADCTKTKVHGLGESLSAGSPESQLKLSNKGALNDTTNSFCEVSHETLSSKLDITEPLAKVSIQSTSAGTALTSTSMLGKLTLNSSTNDSTPTINAEVASDTTIRGLAKDLSESSGNIQTASKIASESPTKSSNVSNSNNTNTSGNVVLSDSASTRKTRMSSKVTIGSTSTTTTNDSVRVSVTTRSRFKETSVPTSIPTSSNRISQPVVKMTSNKLQVLKEASDPIKSSPKSSTVVNAEKSAATAPLIDTPVGDELDVIDLCDGEDLPPMDDDEDNVIETETMPTKTHKLPSLEKLGPGFKVLAKKKNDTWGEATISSVIKDSNEQKKYRISFDGKSKSLVSSKHLAVHCYPCGYPAPSLVHIGSRIVAECVTPSKGSYLCAGIITELPLRFNKARYLVFFDDGCVQYMSLKSVHLVYEVSYNVWEDVPECSTEFIKEYLEKYPERPMVRLHRGQCIKTKSQGVWWRAKVQEADGSLVNMHFPSTDRTEWIYRGSPRMEPLHRELETAKYLRESGRLIAGSSVSKKRGGPCVEYQRVNPDFLVSESDILAMLEGKITAPRGNIAYTSRFSQSKSVVSTRTVDKMPVVLWAVGLFREWHKTHSSGNQIFENLPNDELSELLEGVYKKGYVEQPDIFTSHTLKALRCSLSTFLTEPPISRIIDINKAQEFIKANQAFNETIKIIDKVKELPPKKLMIGQPGINKRDLVKLLRSGLVSLSNPLGLLRLVWIFMQIVVGRTKGKIKSLDLDLLQRKDVVAKKAKSGLPYYEIHSTELGLSGGQEQRIYATGNRFYCPYFSISLYITKLNPNCQDFLQKPRTKIVFKQEPIWFDAEPLSSSSISTMMYDIASAARLSKSYSNVDIRATVWEHLQEAIEEFTENLRNGYKKVSSTANMTSSTSTKTTATSVINKHGLQQPKTQFNIKPEIHQEAGIGKTNVRQTLFHQASTTKQSTSREDSDEDVIIIEESPQPERVNQSMFHSFSTLASQRLVQLSKTVETEKQQTAKKSTSHNFPSYQNDKRHRHSRHGVYSHHRQDMRLYKAHTASSELNPPMDNTRKSVKKLFVHHNCSWTCVAPYMPDAKGKEKINTWNPLFVPEMYGWVRRLAKQKGSGRRHDGKRHVVYQAPCGRSLRDMGEVDRYLKETKMTDLSVDLFCFDPHVVTHPRKYHNSQQPFLKIADISKGSEPVPVSLVNVYDREQPPDVKYIAYRKPEKGSKIITDPGFLICCDCKDNCQDNSKCACRKLTVDSAKAFPEINKHLNEIGYKYRQLNNLVSTGIYECNSKCSCSKQCHNKVVQNGLRLRLQVFKTDKRGWGLRCLDDIPQGAFVCIYAGQLWGAEEANTRGQKYGDEYFAELDHIEIVENSKEGYESDVMEDEGISDTKDSSSSASSSSEQCLSSDEEYHVGSDDSDMSSIAVDVENHSDDSVVMVKGQSGDSTATKMVFRRKLQPEQGTGSVIEGSCWSVEFPEKATSQSKVEAWVNSTLPEPRDTLTQEDNGRTAGKSDSLIGSYVHKSGLNDYSTDRSAKNSTSSQESRPVARKSSGAKKEQNAVKRGTRRENYREGADESSRDSSTSSIINYGYNTSPGKVLDSSQLEAIKRRSLTGRLHMRKKSKDGDEEGSTVSTTVASKSKENEVKRTRSLFAESSGHVMDAKFIGNLGRYLNHSCDPNLFVQSVFVDSHDLRFPWVAFFAKRYVRAETELTWDYNYDVGSVPGKSLICLCGSTECRGRLL